MTTGTVPKSVVRKQPKGGSRKGIPNKVNGDVKAMVLKALENVGGSQYLTEQAIENPKAFLSLLARIIPTQIQGDPDNPLVAAVHYIANIPKRGG